MVTNPAPTSSEPQPNDPSKASTGTCALMRTVRFEVAPGQGPLPGSNAFSANPICAGLGAYFEVTLRAVGRPHDDTAMVQNIHVLDALVRGRLAPLLAAALASPSTDPAHVLIDFARTLGGDDPRLESIELRLNPRRTVTLRTDTMRDVLLCHRYQFAASHRLHNPQLDEETNAAVFGKCSRPSGHGHNYWLEVDVAADVDGPFNRAAMDDIVHTRIIERFDHRNLNVDCPEFADRLPTVEHITMVCHELLAEPIAEAGGTLRQVRVWETEKTWSAYPAEGGR